MKEREQMMKKVTEKRKLFERNLEIERKVQAPMNNHIKSNYNRSERSKELVEVREDGGKWIEKKINGTVTRIKFATSETQIKYTENVQQNKNLTGGNSKDCRLPTNNLSFRVAQHKNFSRESLPGEDCYSPLPSTRGRENQGDGGGMMMREKTTGASFGRWKGNS